MSSLFRRRKRDENDLGLTEVITDSLAKPLPAPHIQTSPLDDRERFCFSSSTWLTLDQLTPSD